MKEKASVNTMKFKTTQKAVKNTYVNVISVNYCRLQHLLECSKPIAYTSSSNGWCADIYDFGLTALTTGYSPFGNIKPSYALCKRYDNKALDLYNDIECRYDYEKRKKALENLIEEFIKEMFEERKRGKKQ